jgi:hypothetical protein
VLAACLLSLALGQPAHAAIGLPTNLGIQSSKTAGTTLSLTIAGGVPDGDSIIVTFAMNYSIAAGVSCADNRGNSYAVDVDAAQVPSGGGSSGVRTVVCSAHNVQGVTAGTIVTVTHPSVTARAMAALSVSGLAKTSPVDQTAAGASGTGPLPSCNTTLPPTTFADELLVAAIGVEGPSGDTLTYPFAWTALVKSGTTGGSSSSNATVNRAYRIVSATGTYGVTGTSLSPPALWASGLVSYKAAPPSAIYYSVGTNAGALYGPANASATSGTLTLAAAAANNIGVGDEIRLGSTGRYYITGRVSSTVFTIQNSGYNGGTPGDTNITFGSQSISIYRAFNSLRDAFLNTAPAYYGDGNHLKTTNLVTGNYQLNIACYADGVMSMANADEVDILTDTTGPANYIRVYTPVLPNEVGVSQRHTGVWGTGFQLSGSNSDIIQIDDDYVRIEGLTILATVNDNVAMWGGIWAAPNGASDVRISKNIIKGNVADASGRQAYGILVGRGNSDVVRVWDNIVYNYPTVSASVSICIAIQYGTVYIFNNTVYDCNTGFQIQNSASAVQLRNNVSISDIFNTTYFVDYVDNFGATRSSNVSSDGTSETPALRNMILYATYFRNTTAGSEDLHLKASSLSLWGQNGTDLSADANLPVTDDIDGEARTRPDIGADEFRAGAIYYSVGISGAVPTLLYNGNASASAGALSRRSSRSRTPPRTAAPRGPPTSASPPRASRSAARLPPSSWRRRTPPTPAT